MSRKQNSEPSPASSRYHASSFRRALVGVALVAAPLASLAQEIVLPETPEGDVAETLAVIAAESGRYEAGQFLGLLIGLLFIPAFVGILQLLRGRAAVLGHVGAMLAIVGAVCFAADNAASFVNLEFVSPEADRSEMIELRERTDDNRGLLVVIVMAFGGLLLGLLLLAIALWRARVVSRWAPGLILAFFVLDMTTAGITKALDVAVHALLALGLGWVGWHVLRMSNADWEHASRRPMTWMTEQQVSDASA